MKTLLLAAAAVLSLGVGAAYAESGVAWDFPGNATPQPSQTQPRPTQFASQAATGSVNQFRNGSAGSSGSHAFYMNEGSG